MLFVFQTLEERLQNYVVYIHDSEIIQSFILILSSQYQYDSCQFLTSSVLDSKHEPEIKMFIFILVTSFKG